MAIGLRDALDTGFAEAAGCAPVAEETLSFAGLPVRLRVAGALLAEQTIRSFAHLHGDPDGCDPALTIELWDETETGISLPEPLDARYTDIRAGRLHHREPGTETRLDRDAGRIVGRRRDARTTTAADRAKPLPVTLPLWYLDRGAGLVHAGLVARGDDGVLIAGRARAGKSTAALACAAAGFSFLGDDQVALAEDAAGFFAHSVYATARLEDADVALTCGGPAETPEPGEKAVLFPTEGRARSAHRARIRAIVLPRSSATPALTAARPGEALLAFAPTSLLGVIGGGAWGFDRLARLVSAVPAFHLSGRVEDLPALVDRALDQ